jgi:hypothetical protein
MASQELVERVKQCGCAERSQHAAQQPCQAEFGEERDAPSAVAGNRRAVAEDEPPTLSACLVGHRSEQPVGLLIREREQGQLLVAVEFDDDPRRPAAEPSATGVQKDRSRKAGDRRATIVQVLHHWSRLRRERSWSAERKRLNLV